ncbi:Fic family protein [Spiroplasma tabanidicola]|uniref:Fic family protein n=1 Tax=Spiroplasma tabanidicola TaxID=324079 RepID=A0A6I6C3X5_9MOLU|nr:Fic family protein [Spiroplasma tabanidicola]QGS51517.1 Fic family protein [Spiroplasma tabanidicola]
MKFKKSYFENSYCKNAYNSAQIEGNKLSAVVFEKIIFHFDEKEIWSEIYKDYSVDYNPILAKWYEEAWGFKRSYSLLYKTIQNNSHDRLDKNLIKEFHLILMELVSNFEKENKGNFRKANVHISNTCVKNSFPEYIEKDLETVIDIFYEMRKKVKDLESKIQALAFLHCGFEIIHPFADGNGRVGRMILTLEALKMGLPPISIDFKNRILYYLALQKSSGTSNPISNSVIERINIDNLITMQSLLYKSIRKELKLNEDSDDEKGYMEFKKVEPHDFKKENWEILDKKYNQYILDESIAILDFKKVVKKMREEWTKKYGYTFKD